MPDVIEELDQPEQGSSSVTANHQRPYPTTHHRRRSSLSSSSQNSNSNRISPCARIPLSYVTAQIARLMDGLDLTAFFQRLGVETTLDIQHIQERDFEDNLPGTTTVVQRKLWRVIQYVAQENILRNETTMDDILKAAKSASAASAISNPLNPSYAQMVHKQIPKFDGSYQNWKGWRDTVKFSLAQTCLGPILKYQRYASAYASRDYFLYNILAEALVDGSAKFLIQRAGGQQQQQQTNQQQRPSSRPSGHKLWKAIVDWYSTKDVTEMFLTEARHTIGTMFLVDARHAKQITCTTSSVSEYIQAFINAKHIFLEHKQSLPENYLSSVFLDNIVDEQYETFKKEIKLRHQGSLDLETCIKELMIAERMVKLTKTKRRFSGFVTSPQDDNEDDYTNNNARHNAINDDIYEDSESDMEEHRSSKRAKRDDSKQGVTL